MVFDDTKREYICDDSGKAELMSSTLATASGGVTQNILADKTFYVVFKTSSGKTYRKVTYNSDGTAIGTKIDLNSDGYTKPNNIKFDYYIENGKLKLEGDNFIKYFSLIRETDYALEFKVGKDIGKDGSIDKKYI